MSEQHVSVQQIYIEFVYRFARRIHREQVPHLGGEGAPPQAEDKLLDHLIHEFAGALTTDEIVRVIDGCRNDLSGYSAAAMPELMRRLAIHRLSALADGADELKS